MTKKKLDAIFLFAYFVCVLVGVFLFKPNHIVGTLLFFGIPGLYLVARYWKIHSHAFTFSLVAGLCTGFPMQVMAEMSDEWKYKPLLPFFQIRGLPLEAVGWWVLWIGFTVCVYQVFFDTHPYRMTKKHKFWKNHGKFLLLAGSIVSATLFALTEYPSVFTIPYAYLIFGSLFTFLPMLCILYVHPHLFKEIFKAAIFLSIFALMYEIVGLRVGWWTYPGNYVGTITILGAAIPLEEICMWISLGSLAAITAYEEIDLR